MIDNPNHLDAEFLKRELVRFTPASYHGVTTYWELQQQSSAKLSKLSLESIPPHCRLPVPWYHHTQAYIPKRGSKASHVQSARANSLPLFTHQAEL